MCGGVELPEDVPCRQIAAAHSFTQFWRCFHAGWGRWFAAFIFVPLGGGHAGLVAVWLFSCLLHPHAGGYWAAWALVNATMLAVEAALRSSPACAFYAADPRRRSVVVRGVNQSLVLVVLAGLGPIVFLRDHFDAFLREAQLLIFMIPFCVCYQLAFFGRVINDGSLGEKKRH